MWGRMEKNSIQVQSILYNNEPEAIARTVESLAGAVRVAREAGCALGPVTMAHGDASESPVFTDEAYAALAAPHAGLLDMRLRFFNENTGHSKGQNLLAQNCESEYILILNPDVVVNPRIFLQLLAPFAGGENVGITEARQTPIEHSKEYDPKTGDTCWAAGACILFPARVFREVGGFDHELFYMYCDDVDFSWKVRMAGYRVVFVPGAPVYHAKRLSHDGKWQPTAAEEYYSAEAGLFLPYKWSNPVRVQTILDAFEKLPEDAPAAKARQEFLRRKKEGLLPQPLDPEGKIASFTHQGYGRYRFTLE